MEVGGNEGRCDSFAEQLSLRNPSVVWGITRPVRCGVRIICTVQNCFKRSRSWKPRLIERFSPERKRISWENFEEKRERRAFQEQGALGLILELEKRVNMNVGNEDVKDKSGSCSTLDACGEEYKLE
ncbi:hypothetical protein Lal_00016898 [Lupinus albus]|nr:hypothetical protein Lal_00016898 [Lupinus albus]